MLRSDTGAPKQAHGPWARQERPMATHGAPTGLCTTCVHAPLCTYPRCDEQSVVHCGEFEGETLRSSASSPAPLASRRANSAREALPLGLCANCGQYPSCRYPKAEGGVWQCDEYR